MLNDIQEQNQADFCILQQAGIIFRIKKFNAEKNSLFVSNIDKGLVTGTRWKQVGQFGIVVLTQV